MKKQLIDIDNGDVVKNIDVDYDFCSESGFESGVEFVWKRIDDESDKIALINKDFELVKDFCFRNSSSFYEGLASIEDNGLYGYIDIQGTFVIPPQFMEAEDFEEGLAKVKYAETGKFGFINRSGNLIIGCYDVLGDFSDGLVYARDRNSGVFHFLDKNGEIALTMEYPEPTNPETVELNRFVHQRFDRDIEFPATLHDQDVDIKMVNDLFYDDDSLAFCEFHNGLCQYAQQTSEGIKIGFYDKTGSIVIPAQFDFASRFYGGISFYSNGSNIFDCKSGILKSTGEKLEIGDCYWAFKFGYDESEKLFPMRANKRNGKPNANGKYGFVDIMGNIVIAPQFDSLRSFNNGMIKVQVGFKTGFVNEKGEYIIPAEYDNAYFFDEYGFCVACKLGKYDRLLEGIIDKSGNVIAPFIFDEIEILSKERFTARTENGYALYDISGAPVVDREFGRIRQAFDHYVLANMELPEKRIPPTGKIFRKSCNEGRYIYFYECYPGCAEEHGHGFGVMKEDGTILSHQVHEHIGYYSDGLISIEYGLIWNYMDLEGTLVLFDFSDTCSMFIGGMSYVVTHNWAHGSLNMRINGGKLFHKGKALSIMPLVDNITTFIMNKQGDIVQLTHEEQEKFVQKYRDLRRQRLSQNRDWKFDEWNG